MGVVERTHAQTRTDNADAEAVGGSEDIEDIESGGVAKRGSSRRRG